MGFKKKRTKMLASIVAVSQGLPILIYTELSRAPGRTTVGVYNGWSQMEWPWLFQLKPFLHITAAEWRWMEEHQVTSPSFSTMKKTMVDKDDVSNT